METASATVLLTKDEMETIVDSLLDSIRRYCATSSESDPSQVEIYNREKISLLEDIAPLCQHPIQYSLMDRNDKDELLFIKNFINAEKD